MYQQEMLMSSIWHSMHHIWQMLNNIITDAATFNNLINNTIFGDITDSDEDDDEDVDKNC